MRAVVLLRCWLIAALVGGAAGLSTGPKTCDAINMCDTINNGAAGVCPDGMELVGAPVRSDTYAIETAATSYTPGDLVPISIKVTQREIQAMRNAGKRQCYCEDDNPSNSPRCPGNTMGAICDCECPTPTTCAHPSNAPRRLRRGCPVTGPVMETAKYLGLLMYAA